MKDKVSSRITALNEFELETLVYLYQVKDNMAIFDSQVLFPKYPFSKEDYRKTWSAIFKFDKHNLIKTTRHPYRENIILEFHFIDDVYDHLIKIGKMTE